jgi:hypothetical protein
MAIGLTDHAWTWNEFLMSSGKAHRCQAQARMEGCANDHDMETLRRTPYSIASITAGSLSSAVPITGHRLAGGDGHQWGQYSDKIRSGESLCPLIQGGLVQGVSVGERNYSGVLADTLEDRARVIHDAAALGIACPC